MRKRKNRYQRKTAVLAALMAASSILAAGCGSEGGDSGGSSQTADGGETASIQEEIVKPQSEEEKLKHYDETITLTYAKSEVVTDYPSGQDAQNNALYDMWEEVMGIHVENQITASSDNFNEKMNLAITTGDIPDFAVVDASTMQSLMENELVMDMSGYYDAWATDKLKENLGDTEDAIWSACTSDGKAYGIPVINTVGDQLWELWIRKDWLDALGLEEPTTMEEVQSILYEKQDVRISVTIRKNGKPERWEPDALELYRRKENGFVCGELVVLEGKEAPEGSSGMEGIMEKIDYYIRKNPEKDLSLGYLAELFCFNSSYLSRAFHQYKGEALSSYIIRIRIERAKKLLLDTDEKIYEIAAKSGFETPTYFSRMFNRYERMSPKEYRIKKRGETMR